MHTETSTVTSQAQSAPRHDISVETEGAWQI